MFCKGAGCDCFIVIVLFLCVCIWKLIEQKIIENKMIGGLLKGQVKWDGEGVNDKHTLIYLQRCIAEVQL